MSEFKNVASVADFRSLDESEVLMGYLDGFDGLPCPANARSRSFVHGWRNGMTDAGYAAADADQQTLADDFRHAKPPTLH
jgi:hypothetical protein